MRLSDACFAVFLALIAKENVGEWLGWLVLILSSIGFVLIEIKNELRTANDRFKLKGDKQ